MYYKLIGKVLIECNNGITVEYMGRLVFIALFSTGTIPLLNDDGVLVTDKSNISGECIIRDISYRVTKKGVFILSVTNLDGISRQIKILPRYKGEFKINIVDKLSGEDDYIVKEIKCNKP